MKKLAIIISITAILASCQKDELDVVDPISKIDLALVINRQFKTKKQGIDCRDSKTTKIVMVTDRGVFESKASQSGFNIHTDSMEVTAERHRIYALYGEDDEGYITVSAFIGVPDAETEQHVVGRVNGYKYDFTKDVRFMMQMFCK